MHRTDQSRSRGPPGPHTVVAGGPETAGTVDADVRADLVRRIQGRVPAPAGRARMAVAAALLLAAGGLAGLSACSSSSNGSSSASGAASALASALSSATAGFSGEPPSALASKAASAVASASARVSSAAAAASSFEASVSAAGAKASQAAVAALAPVSGAGNATADVKLTGVPTANSGGLHAVVVTITNHSGATASYAVKIDFNDSSGKTVDTAIVGAENLAPGKSATPVAFSRQPESVTLIPKVAQAQRY